MHALTILHRCLGPLLGDIHRKRLATLLAAVAATVSGPRLTLTDIGQRFAGGASLRNKIKRSDRLLGNRHLQKDARTIYGALARNLLAGVAEPLIVIDWSDLKADQSLHLLRASLPVGGRCLTLYEEVHTQKDLGNRKVQHRFLQRLGALLPVSAAPIIVADSGFKVPFYRVRGRDYVKLKYRWISCQRVFKRATTTATTLGVGEWVRSNPLRVTFALVRLPARGRQDQDRPGQAGTLKKRGQKKRGQTRMALR